MTFPPRSLLHGPVSRRRFARGVAALGALAALPFPFRSTLAATNGAPLLDGRDFALEIGPVPMNVTGQTMTAVGINGRVPAPILRWREGDTVTLAVTNRLSEPSSIHWHGIRTPTHMDGVPGLSFSGIAPGETFTYRFPVHQNGTYWYHSHSGFQEQSGLYGAIVIEPRAGYAQKFDRDYVVLLSDWSDEHPETIVSNLKFRSDHYNFGQRTAGTFLSDVRIPGLKLMVVQADGNDVEPVTVDEFRIGTSETYDVIVQPDTDRAFTIFAQTIDRSGFARGTLAPRSGMAGAVPPPDPRPLRGMADMGMADMNHGSMPGMDMSGTAVQFVFGIRSWF